MQPVDHARAFLRELVAAVGEQSQHRRVVLRPHGTQRRAGLGGERNGTRVCGVGLPATGEQAHARHQPRRDIDDRLALREQPLAEAVAETAGPLHGPAALGPLPRPAQQLSVRTSFHPELAELAARGVDGEGGMRGFCQIGGRAGVASGSR